MKATLIICSAAVGICLISSILMIFSWSWNLDLHPLFPYIQERCFVSCCHTKEGKKKEDKWMDELFNSFKRTNWKGFLGETQTSKMIMRSWKGNNRIFFSFFLRLIFFSKATDQFGLFLKAFPTASFKAIVLEESSVKSHLFRMFFVCVFFSPLNVDG